MRHLLSWLQILACLVIAAVGLVPVFHRNKPFFGQFGSSISGSPPHIHQVDAHTPAAASGIRAGDRILAINGVPGDLNDLTHALQQLRPGEFATLKVKRGEQELELKATAQDPVVSIIYYPTFVNPILGAVGLILALIVFATQPIVPAPRWRPVLLMVAGVGLAIGFGILEMLRPNIFMWIDLARFHTVSLGDRLLPWQNWLGVAAGFLLALFGAMELRARLRSPPLYSGEG